jgi:LDH2 family malate/lactate/ureidoglycolate dehydrogenase
VGAFMLALDIERFMPLGTFAEIFRNYLASIKAVKKAPGTVRIYLPGEIEYEKELHNLTEGIEVNPDTAAKLDGLLAAFGSPLRLELK